MAEISPGERHKRGVIGPFTARQLGMALLVVAVAAGALLVATRPIAANPVVPAAGAPSQYAVGPVTQGLRVGDQAPDLIVHDANGNAAPLTDLDGKPILLAALRGHPVWIDFWASWCPPCQAETPVLRDLYNSYKSRGLVLIAISVQETSVADVRSYAQRYGLGYTIGADLRGDVFRQYRIYGLPTQFFLDENGVIRYIIQGPVDLNMGVSALNLIVPGGVSASPSPAASPSR